MIWVPDGGRQRQRVLEDGPCSGVPHLAVALSIVHVLELHLRQKLHISTCILFSCSADGNVVKTCATFQRIQILRESEAVSNNLALTNLSEERTGAALGPGLAPTDGYGVAAMLAQVRLPRRVLERQANRRRSPPGFDVPFAK